MFERYTPIERRVIQSSVHKARIVGSSTIETEHLLWGLLTADKGLARRFLGSPWAVEKLWEKIQRSRPIHNRIQGPVDLPLSSESKRVLSYAAEEAGRTSSKHIGTEHLLLGLLREENCFAAEFLDENGVRPEPTREELIRIPHDDSATEEFVIEREPLPEDVVDLQTRVESIRRQMEYAVAQDDFAKARECAEEPGREREKLRALYQQYGLLDWLYD